MRNRPSKILFRPTLFGSLGGYNMPHLLQLNLQFFSSHDDGGGYTFDDEQLSDYSFELDEPGEEPPNPEGDGEELLDENSEPESGEENPEENLESQDDGLIDLGELGKVSKEDIQAWKQGHMMQSDYTKKTQELSQQRQEMEKQFETYKRLDNMLQNDPQLQQQFVELMQSQQNPQNQTQNQNPEFDIQNHPQFKEMNEQMKQMQEQLQNFNQSETQRQIQAEWSDLVNRYPDAKDMQKELAQFADENNLNLENAYRVMNFENVRKQTQQELVKNNMKKKPANTVKPNNPGPSNDAKTIPDGDYDSLVAFLSKKNLNLSE